MLYPAAVLQEVPYSQNGFLALSIFTGLQSLALITFAFRVGGWVTKIQDHDRRITAVETHGSPAVQSLDTKIDIINQTVLRVESMMIEHVTRREEKS